MKKFTCFVILLLLFSGHVKPVHAQTGINILNSQAVLRFPESVTFKADIQGDYPISLVILEYGVEQLTCGEVIAKAFPVFTPGMSVSVEWVWDMRQSGSEPPGAVIWWRWRVIDSNGQETVSSRQSITWLDNLHPWQSISGGNINLHWYSGDQSLGQQLHQSAVSALERLAQDTGIQPEQPVDLYIYANTQDMQDAILYEPSWTGGMAFSENNIVIIGISAYDIEWGKRTQAHELTHVLIGHLTFSCLGFLPTWLSEGLAMYGEGGLDTSEQNRLNNAISNDTLMSVRSLSGGFSEEYERANLAYAESYSIVNFLLEQYGSQKMTSLLEVLREGVALEEALSSIYGFGVDGLEDAWREHIGASPRIQSSNPTPIPTPTIVPTIVPISGVPLAVVAETVIPDVQPTPSFSVPTSTEGDIAAWDFDLQDGVVLGLIGCALIFVLLILIVFLVLRKRRRQP